jgi:hypothetical protein
MILGIGAPEVSAEMAETRSRFPHLHSRSPHLHGESLIPHLK